MTKTALWMKHRYGIKYYDAFRCFTVKGKPAKEGKEKEPYKNIAGKYERPQALTGEQQRTVSRISEAMDAGRQENFLIHGVTASRQDGSLHGSHRKSYFHGKGLP